MDYNELINFTNEKNEFVKYNDIKVVSVNADYAQVELEISYKSLNPYSIVHGGVYYTMADCAAGIIARSDGKRYVTLNGSINYIRSASKGKIKAISTIEHKGKSTCIVNVKITDEDEILLATAKFTMFCLNKANN